jgi:hypothetical protein
MPTFESFQQSQAIKGLYLGESGSGKTGSLVALGAMGYNVRIVDLDKGVEVLSDFIMNPDSPYRHDSGKPNGLLRGWEPIKGLWSEEMAAGLPKRVSYVPLNETMNTVKMQGGQMRSIPKGDLYSKIVAQLDKWIDGEADYGSITSWTNKDVLVIDGLSRFSDAIFNQQLAMGGRLTGRPEQSDYNVAQRELIRNLMTLYSGDVKCHVIMICHIAFIETDSGPTRGFPQNIGKAIAPQIGQFFNHAILADSSGQGQLEKRVIKTNTSGMVKLKTAAPLRARPEYPLATGLAQYFRDVLGTEVPGK